MEYITRQKQRNVLLLNKETKINRGSQSTISILEAIDEQAKHLDQARKQMDKKVILEKLAKESKQGFDIVRQEAKLKDYNMKKQRPKRKKKIQNKGNVPPKSSYDINPFMQGCVQFGKLTSKHHLELIKNEFIECGYDKNLIMKLKITALKKKLLEDEINRTSGASSMKEIKFFKPIGETDINKWYNNLQKLMKQ
jgi:hypothetical protein